MSITQHCHKQREQRVKVSLVCSNMRGVDNDMAKHLSNEKYLVKWGEGLDSRRQIACQESHATPDVRGLTDMDRLSIEPVTCMASSLVALSVGGSTWQLPVKVIISNVY